MVLQNTLREARFRHKYNCFFLQNVREMYKKSLIIICLMITAVLTGCQTSYSREDVVTKGNDKTTLKDIVYKKNNDSINSLYILEGKEMIPFLVMTS